MSKQRKIPATMVTQHPDNAAKPYWHDKPYVSTQFETEEAFLSFSELGGTEYKWDWEGKFVDESVLERFFSQYGDYFSQKQLGKDIFLTFRLPNPKVETEFRISRAFMNIMSASSLAKHVGLHTPPLFEVILPMTETAEEILAIQEAFSEMHLLKHPIHRMSNGLDQLHVIPLFEQVEIMMNSDKILETYLKNYEKMFDRQLPYLRPYLARSDPALNSGLIATVLGIKIALSHYEKFSKEKEIQLYPVIGAGSLPFRGGISPLTVKQFADEYKGIRTTTLQSAFRYDYPKDEVIKAIAYLEDTLPEHKAIVIDSNAEKQLRDLIRQSEQYYKQTIELLAPVVNTISQFIPKRRERFLHIGLFGYSRGVGKVKLPRAIPFTAALYSLGIPPEFIGTGQTIKYAKQTGQLELLKKYYVNLKEDVYRTGKFVNKNNISKLAKTSLVWKEIEESIKLAEKYLNVNFEPQTREEKEHYRISGKIYANLQINILNQEDIEQAALLRKSIG